MVLFLRASCPMGLTDGLEDSLQIWMRLVAMLGHCLPCGPQSPTLSPQTIALYGPWGSSSLREQMEFIFSAVRYLSGAALPGGWLRVTWAKICPSLAEHLITA